jgi:DNA-binding NtrC family response regulator
VVDAERLQRWALAESLANAGCEVVEARTIAAAITVLDEDEAPVRVVIVDERLPDGSGLELVRRVKARGGCQAILTTSDLTTDLAGAAHAAGARLAVGKPFDLGDIMRAVLDILRDEAR